MVEFFFRISPPLVIIDVTVSACVGRNTAMPDEAFDWSLEVGAEKVAWSDMMLICFPISTATVVRKKHKIHRSNLRYSNTVIIDMTVGLC